MADDEVQETEAITESQAEIAPAKVTPLDPPKYEIRPKLGEKFQADNVREIIIQIMQEQLMGRVYRVDQAPHWAKMIANGVRSKVEDLGMKRYKIMAQTTIMEMKGAGAKCAQRCIWDPETDDYAASHYRNDSIFCYTICYGVYMY
ncbi:tctex1 domain-containing protein 2-like isoform X2 [Hyposmocoma kahamanoa]|uniref:tctex1 domain-containing protein 2-like isoform X2 n=1 Tax=Hyposmocoma kahamanoa TaxID=1477025 RepID=UPI000E6D5F6C|nr:tctex1 domain-containing protein 2-like isoform X2 [Hyposmocoma kahamanoa]